MDIKIIALIVVLRWTGRLVNKMTLDEAREEIGDIDNFYKNACYDCTANDWFCPDECDNLKKARQIDFDRIVKAYARYDGDLSKVFRYINQAKIDCKKGR